MYGGFLVFIGGCIMMYKIQGPLLRDFWPAKKIRWRSHHYGSVIKCPGIGVKPYYTLSSIQIKRLHNKRIFFMRSIRFYACVMRTQNSTSPLDVSNFL